MQIEDRKWFYDSTQTLNLNIYNQNEKVVDVLQNKHTVMFNGLQQKHTDILNSLGHMKDDINANILKGTETIKSEIHKSCKKHRRNRRLPEESRAFYDAVIEESLNESYIENENEEVEKDSVELVQVNMKLEQLQKDVDDRFALLEDKFEDRLDRLENKFEGLEDKFEDRLDRLETLLGRLVEQQQVA